MNGFRAFRWRYARGFAQGETLCVKKAAPENWLIWQRGKREKQVSDQ